MSKRLEGPPADPQGGPPPRRHGWWDTRPGLGWQGRENPELQGQAREAGHQQGQKRPGPPRPSKVVGPRTPQNPTRRPRRRPTTLPTGVVGCTEGPRKERTRRTGPPRPRKRKTQRPGCRPRRPHMPRRSPTTRPTRAVGHAAPWGGRCCLARRHCLGLPQAAK